MQILDTSENLSQTENLEITLLYTKKLCCYFIRRADQLIQEDKDDVIPYCIATGDVKKLVHFFMSRGQLKEALLVAQVQTRNDTGWTHWEGRVGGGRSCSRDGQSCRWLGFCPPPDLLSWTFQSPSLCSGHTEPILDL